MSVSNKCVFVILGVVVALSRSDGMDNLNLRESCGTYQRPLKHSQESLSCARVLSRGEKILTQSELLWRRDWLEGILLGIGIFTIRSNLLVTIILCRTLLYIYRQLRMNGSERVRAKVSQTGMQIVRNFSEKVAESFV